MNQRSEHRLGGVFAAALTPLRGDLSPDHGAMLGHYRWLLDHGCDGLAVLGTTGEANSFSVEERLAMIEALAASDIDPGRLLIGTGCCAIPDTVRLSRAALELGAAGVLMLPPFYYKNPSEDGLFAAFAEVVERLGDARLAVYVYHFPAMTGIDIGLGLLERLVAAYPGTVVGLKDSSGDWSHTEAVCRALPGFAVFAGSEQLLLPVLEAGGAGCISASVNVTCQLAAKLYARWREGDAVALQEDLSEVRLIIQGYPMIAALKRILAQTRGRSEWLNMRPPLTPLGPDQAAALLGALEGAGLVLPAAA
ncbi:MAG: dihydrodipicolinate synthase family protein [Alphaproteobacteria bacterium]